MTPAGVSYRPDRLLLDGKKATVINFTDAERDQNDLLEMERYVETLAGMGFGPVEAYVVYFPIGTVEKIAEA